MIALLGIFRFIPSWCYGLLAFVVLAGAGAVYERHAGETIVQKQWDAEKAQQIANDKAAVEMRNESNRMLARAQSDRSTLIQKAHDDEIAKVRSSITNQRLRIGTALCSTAGSSNSTSASGSNGTDTGSGLVSESTQRAINDLEMKVENALATGRAAQAFIRENGLLANQSK